MPHDDEVYLRHILDAITRSELRLKTVHIPWGDIAGMRDKLTHHYFGVDIGEV